MEDSPPPPPPPPHPKRYTIGYALTPKKQKSFIRPSLLSLASASGFDLVEVEPSLPISPQGPFHLILHKLPSSEPWRRLLLLFSSSHPSVPILDHPDSILRLRDRLSMLRSVSNLPPYPSPPTSFGVPAQFLVSYPDDLLSIPSSLRFPLVAKPLLADGSAKSHKMSLLFNHQHLPKLNPPIILQEFVNHGGVLFKAYVVRDHVRCVKRRSLPDVTDHDHNCSVGSVPFSLVSNVNGNGVHYECEAEMPPKELIEHIARGLRKETGLNLFNFDIIRDARDRDHYVVIDVNYFPGYAKMPSYETVFVELFEEMLRGDSKGGVVNSDQDSIQNCNLDSTDEGTD